MNALMLEFQPLAEEAFAFLETSLGFRKCLLADGLIRYETEDIFVVVGYDGRRSFELSLDIGQRNVALERAFNFGEVLRSVKAPVDLPSSYQVTSKIALNRFLNELAQSLEKYGRTFLQNNHLAFAKLLQLRERECSQYALKRDLRILREESEAAWKKKDYAAVVKTLSPFRAALTATEVGKLEFAEKEIHRKGIRD